MTRPPPRSTLFPYTTLFRSVLKLATSPAREFHELRLLRHFYEGLGLDHRCRVVVVTDFLADEQMRDLRSEEHTSELQSHVNLVCRLLLEKKKKTNIILKQMC